MRKLFVALFLLCPVIASAQITVSPDRIAYNANPDATPTSLAVSGSFRPGNVGTFVDFTYTDGGVAEVEANSATSELITCYVPASVMGQPGLWTVSLLFVDDTGVRTQGSASLTIYANLPPLLTVPEVVTAEATSASGAPVDFADQVSGFSFVDPLPAPTISCTPASGTTFALGTTIVTCTATDSFGSSHSSFKVFVGDTTPPTIHVPAPITSTSSVVSYTVTATDLVDGAVAVTCAPASGSTFATGVTIVQCSATDAHDNNSSASFQVSVGAPPAPTLTLPANMTLISDRTEGLTVAYEVSADQEAAIVCTPASGSFFPAGTTTVSCTATNVFGVSSTGSFTITVIADPRPLLLLPADINVDPATPSGTHVTFTATATDSVDGTIPVVCTPASGALFPLGSTLVQCSATNSRGYSRYGTFYVFVRDSTPPVLSLPARVNVASSGSPDGTEVNYDASAHDAVDGDVAISCEPVSGALFPDGQTTVECRAVDLSGNLATGSFVVTVGDTQPPVITFPGSVTAEATGPTGAVVTYTVTAVDNFDGVVPVVCSPASGTLFHLGTTQVTCTARDSSNNMAIIFFNVFVVDTTPPALHLPSDITAPAGASCSATVTYTATATDLVDGNVNVTCTPPSGSSFALGTVTVNCSATDAHNNTATGSFHVTVQDVTPPTIRSLTPTPSNIWPVNHKYVDVTIAADVVDNCDTAPVTRIIGVTANQPILGPGSGNTTPDWIITGDLTLTLRAERTNNQDRIYTLTVTSTDSSGNVSTATVQVFVSQANNGN